MQPVTDPALLAQLNGGGGGPQPVTDPALLAQLNGTALPPVLDTPAPVTASGTAKAAASGAVRGGIGLATLLDAAGEMGARGIDAATRYATGKLGIAPPQPYKPQDPWRADNALTDAFERNVTPLHKPQNTVEQYAQTVGEFAPNAAFGPGGLVRRAALGVMTPAIASEAAGQATAGTAAEPYARAAAAMAAGVPGMRGAARATAVAPTADELRTAGAAGFDAVRASGASLHPAALDRVAQGIRNELEHRGLNVRLAGDTHGILDDMQAATPAGAAVDFSNVHTMRQTFGNAARSINPNERAAARTAIEHLDDYLRNIPAGDVIGGNAQQTANTLRTAIDNYGAAMRADRIRQGVYRAENAAAVSGGRVADDTRGQFKSMLNSPNGTRGLSPDEVAQMERVVRGSLALNAVRRAGGLMGGGSNLHSVATAALAGHVLGLPGLVLPLAGNALKGLANRATMKQVGRLDEMVRSRSPLGLNGLRLPGETVALPGFAFRLATAANGSR